MKGRLIFDLHVRSERSTSRMSLTMASGSRMCSNDLDAYTRVHTNETRNHRAENETLLAEEEEGEKQETSTQALVATTITLATTPHRTDTRAPRRCTARETWW